MRYSRRPIPIRHNILVGHSLGGLYMQMFARKYPKEVSGIVLLENPPAPRRPVS